MDFAALLYVGYAVRIPEIDGNGANTVFDRLDLEP